MPDLSFETLLIYMLFVVPGVVTLKVYDLLLPSDKRNYSESIIEVIFYSLLNLGVVSWAIYLLFYFDISTQYPILFAICIPVFLLCCPTLLAFLVFRLRTSSKFLSRWITLHPYPTGWDYFFMKQQRCWILFHLKNGRKVGGYFGDKSCASAYPRPQEIYVEQVWRVDDLGRFKEKVSGTAGMVVRYNDCDLIEFFEEG